MRSKGGHTVGKERIIIMNTINETNATRTADGGRIPEMTKKVGNTTYEVHIHFSETSKETMTDKILRLIRNEALSKDVS